jgi:inner membrane protein
MLIQTHFAITAFFAILFLSKIENKVAFVLVLFFAALIPDIDSRFSRVGRAKGLRILQFFVKHRGLIHSFTFAFLITLFFVLFFPVVAFPFFLGYSLHLLADSFTIEGIKPFYPFKKTISWKIKNGSMTEITILFMVIFIDFLLLFFRIFSAV